MDKMLERLEERINQLTLDGYNPNEVSLLVSKEEEAWLVRQPALKGLQRRYTHPYCMTYYGWQISVRVKE